MWWAAVALKLLRLFGGIGGGGGEEVECGWVEGGSIHPAPVCVLGRGAAPSPLVVWTGAEPRRPPDDDPTHQQLLFQGPFNITALAPAGEDSKTRKRTASVMHVPLLLLLLPHPTPPTPPPHTHTHTHIHTHTHNPTPQDQQAAHEATAAEIKGTLPQPPTPAACLSWFLVASRPSELNPPRWPYPSYGPSSTRCWRRSSRPGTCCRPPPRPTT